MNGKEVYPVLSRKRIEQLHHANSVRTSVSFLRAGGLVSRGHAERYGLDQTEQFSDATDRQFGVWDDIFTDSVDIHARTNDRNKYGPVLFVLDSPILLALPEGAEVKVTKLNPSKWKEGQPDHERYFTSVAELDAGLTRGTFDQMISIRIRDGLLPFGTHLRQIVLDDPMGKRKDGSDAFSSSQAQLQTTASGCGISIQVSKRVCRDGCKCVASYAEKATRIPYFF